MHENEVLEISGGYVDLTAADMPQNVYVCVCASVLEPNWFSTRENRVPILTIRARLRHRTSYVNFKAFDLFSVRAAQRPTNTLCTSDRARRPVAIANQARESVRV